MTITVRFKPTAASCVIGDAAGIVVHHTREFRGAAGSDPVPRFQSAPPRRTPRSPGWCRSGWRGRCRARSPAKSKAGDDIPWLSNHTWVPCWQQQQRQPKKQQQQQLRQKYSSSSGGSSSGSDSSSSRSSPAAGVHSHKPRHCTELGRNEHLSQASMQQATSPPSAQWPWRSSRPQC